MGGTSDRIVGGSKSVPAAGGARPAVCGTVSHLGGVSDKAGPAGADRTRMCGNGGAMKDRSDREASDDVSRSETPVIAVENQVKSPVPAPINGESAVPPVDGSAELPVTVIEPR